MDWFNILKWVLFFVILGLLFYSAFSKKKQRKIDPEAADALQQIDPNSLPAVPLKDQTIPVRVTSIPDGDTLEIVFFYGQEPMKLKLRLEKVDAPEIDTPAGKEVQRWVENRLSPSFLGSVQFRKWDKYGGRVDGQFFLPSGENLSDLLLAQGLARASIG